MKTTLIGSRISALIQCNKEKPHTVGWFTSRILANRPITLADINIVSHSLDGSEVLVGWAKKAPDWPISARQARSIKTMLDRAYDSNVGPAALELAHQEKWTALISLLTKLDTPALSQQAGYYLLNKSDEPLSEQVRPVVRLIAIQCANTLINSDRKTREAAKYTANPQLVPYMEANVWRDERLAGYIKNLEQCVGFLGAESLKDPYIHSRLSKIQDQTQRLIRSSDETFSAHISECSDWIKPYLNRHNLTQVAAQTGHNHPSAPPRPTM